MDDDPFVLESLREIVEKEGRYKIAVAENGKKALESAPREIYSVMIKDLMLRDITGTDLLSSLAVAVRLIHKVALP